MKSIFQHKLFAVFCVCLLTFLPLWYFFQTIFNYPDSFLFSRSVDALKNYFIPAWYIKHDNGIWFSGMNYPYGEHSLFTDNQFPIAYMCQWLQRMGFNIADHTSAIINYLLLLSFFPCAIFLFLLLDEFKVARWYSVLCAVAITMLSPQVQRITGHFSLAYPFVIPMVMYFLMRMMKSEIKWKWFIYICIAATFSGLMHLYHAAMVALFLISFAFFYFIAFRSRKNFRFKDAIYVLLAGIIPLMILKGYVFLTDPVQDRVQIPWGFLLLHADFQTVFYPPFWSWNKLFGSRERMWEGYAFIGIVGQVAFIAFCTRTLFYAFKRKFSKIFFLPVPDFLLISFWASVPVLLFSISLPWIWGMQEYLNYIPFIQQFRSAGRFAWVFYYVFSLYSAFYLYLVFRMILMKRLQSVAYFIAALLFIGWSVDVFYNFKHISNEFQQARLSKDFFRNDKYVLLLREKGYAPKDFQAVLSFPMFEEGSEKLTLHVREASLIEAIKTSYSTGLPLMNGYTGRTSVSESMKLMQMASGPATEKSILNELKSNLPILLVSNQLDQLSNFEKQIIEKAELIFTEGPVDMYKLSLESLRSQYEDMRLRFYKQPQLFSYDSVYLTSPSKALVMKRFSSGSTSKKFLDKGKYLASGDLALYNGIIPFAADSQVFEASFWEKVFTESYEIPLMYYRQYEASGKLIEEQVVNPCTPTENYDGWYLANFTFTLWNSDNRVEFFMQGRQIEIDRFLIKPMGLDVYAEVRSDSSFVVNNYYISPPLHAR
ncbi:MAG: hypothetical protein ABI729_05710 [Chitinophagales bacterium]